MSFEELRLIAEKLDSGKAHWLCGYLQGFHDIKNTELKKYKQRVKEDILGLRAPCFCNGESCMACNYNDALNNVLERLGLDEE